MTILLTDHLPQDLAPLLKAAGVDQIVVVEGAETVQETHFVFELAQKYPFIAGVVGWVDLASPDIAARPSSLEEPIRSTRAFGLATTTTRASQWIDGPSERYRL